MERMPSLNQLYKYYNDDRLYPWTRTSLDGNLEVLDRVRLMVFEEILKRFPLENKVVLEVGCGSGVFTKAAVVHSKSVTGTDVAKKAIKELALENKDEKLKFITAAAENLPFKRNSFDAVLCFETLEHLKSPVAVLGEIYRVLKKNGYLVIVQDTDSLLFNSVWWFWTKWKGSVWNHSHINCLKPKELIKKVRKANFKIISMEYTNLGMEVLIKAQKK